MRASSSPTRSCVSGLVSMPGVCCDDPAICLAVASILILRAFASRSSATSLHGLLDHLLRGELGMLLVDLLEERVVVLLGLGRGGATASLALRPEPLVDVGVLGLRALDERLGVLVRVGVHRQRGPLQVLAVAGHRSGAVELLPRRLRSGLRRR